MIPFSPPRFRAPRDPLLSRLDPYPDSDPDPGPGRKNAQASQAPFGAAGARICCREMRYLDGLDILKTHVKTNGETHNIAPHKNELLKPTANPTLQNQAISPNSWAALKASNEGKHIIVNEDIYMHIEVLSTIYILYPAAPDFILQLPTILYPVTIPQFTTKCISRSSRPY